MARPRATEAQRQAQRRRIRRAALEISEESGVDSVSVRGVAARAGVSQGTIYSYFTDRSELVRSLWLEPVTKVGHKLERLAAEHADPVERIRAILLAFVDFVTSHPEVHRGAMLFVRPASQPPPEPAPPEELVFYRLMLEAVSEHAANSGVTLDDPGRSVELIWAALHGSLGLAINTDIYQISPARDLALDMVELLMHAVVAPLATGDIHTSTDD